MTPTNFSVYASTSNIKPASTAPIKKITDNSSMAKPWNSSVANVNKPHLFLANVQNDRWPTATSRRRVGMLRTRVTATAMHVWVGLLMRRRSETMRGSEAMRAGEWMRRVPK
jgi:hypothetical protein